LVSQSRNLSWQTAQKEAARRKVDISGSVPSDLKTAGTAKVGDTRVQNGHKFKVTAVDTNGKITAADPI